MFPLASPCADAGWLVPDWPAVPGVAAVFSLRTGGVSAAPWTSLNLGDHVGDSPSAVDENRRRMAARCGAVPVFLRQVHGMDCVDIDDGPRGTTVDRPPVADACTAVRPGVACTVLVADCLPVLLCDSRGRAVAAAHAGWRGLAAGVLEGCVRSLRGRLGRDGPAAELRAWLGPCIGPGAFEVGPEVRRAFLDADPDAAACFGPEDAAGQSHADLAALARRRLAAAVWRTGRG